MNPYMRHLELDRTYLFSLTGGHYAVRGVLVDQSEDGVLEVRGEIVTGIGGPELFLLNAANVVHVRAAP